jgi:hypothetical protein
MAAAQLANAVSRHNSTERFGGFKMWRSAELRRASPKNHQGKIIPPPHCLTTVEPEFARDRVSQLNASSSQARQG